MRRCIPLLVFATACSGVGADLTIHSDVDLDRVELFVATAYCVDPDHKDEINPCTEGVGWTPSMSRPAGEIFHMKDPLVIVTELANPRTAEIRLEVAESFEPITIAIVGYANGVPVVGAELRDVSIPVNTAEHWRIDLVDVGIADDSTAAPAPGAPQQRVHTWARRNHGAEYVGCAVYQTWHGDRWKSRYYGPDQDPDCDDHELECDEYWFDRSIGSTQGCLFDRRLNFDGGCRVGVSGCVDGMPAMEGCAVGDITQPIHCFDDALCEACAGAANLEACAIDELKRSSIAGFECRFTPDSTFLPCQVKQTVAIHLPDGCLGGDQLRLRRLEDDPLGLSTAGDTFIILNGVSFHGRVEADSGTCKLLLEWEGGSAANFQDAYLMADVWYPMRHLFTPVHIEFTSPAECSSISAATDCTTRGRAYTIADTNCM